MLKVKRFEKLKRVEIREFLELFKRMRVVMSRDLIVCSEVYSTPIHFLKFSMPISLICFRVNLLRKQCRMSLGLLYVATKLRRGLIPGLNLEFPLFV